MRLLAVDRETGATTVLRDDSDACWLDVVPGVPARLADGRIVWTADADGARRLLVASERELADGTAEPVTPPDLQVRSVLSVDGDTVLMSGSDGESIEIGVWAYGPGGLTRFSGDCTVRADGTVRPDGTKAALRDHGAAEHRGVHGAVRAGGTTVLTSRSMAGLRTDCDGAARQAGRRPAVVTTIASLAERPALPGLRVELLRAGRREIRTALLLPSWHEPGSAKLPGPDGPVRRAARRSECSRAPTPT